jgi:hypothetical protein
MSRSSVQARSDSLTGSPGGHSSSGEEWCDLLESLDLDSEQADALTRATVERAKAWLERREALIPGAALRRYFADSPTHPDVLRRGLELWRDRRGL